MKFDTIEKLLAMLLIQKTNLPTYKTQVGASDEDIAEVMADADNLQFVVDLSALIEANKKAVNRIKQQVYSGDPDEIISAFPVFPIIVPPNVLIAGCLDRANARNRRFKSAKGYSKEIGIALGIDGDSPSVVSEDIKPTVDVSPAQTNYEGGVMVGKRGKSQMWKLMGRKMNTEKWFEITSGTGKAASFQITPTVEGQPERLELMILLFKGNEPYGQPSNPVYATFNP